MSTEPTKFVQKVRPVYIDTAGNEIPSPHTPIPYTLQNSFGQNNVTNTNWATALIAAKAYDWYVTLINIKLYSFTTSINDDWFTEQDEGVHVYIAKDITNPATTDDLIEITLSAQKHRPAFTNSITATIGWRLEFTIDNLTYPIRVPAGEDFGLKIYNYSGTRLIFTINAIYFDLQ